MGRVVSIVYKPADVESKPADYFARVPLERARIVRDQGIAGDGKGSVGGTRQLNVMFAEQVESLRAEGFKTNPGELGEQVVVAGLPAADMVPGVWLRLGTAVVEVSRPRTGCTRFEHIQGKPKTAAAGRLGVMVSVVTDGEVAIGDEAEVLAGVGA